MKKDKLYFESIDEVFCRPLEYFIENAGEEGLREIKLVEAIRDMDTKDFVWCTHEGDVTEKEMCRKSECEFYSSKSGRGVCEHRGKLYLHGDEVTVKVN